MKLPRLATFRVGMRSGNLAVFVESYNEFDTQAGLVERLCRRHGWTPHFVGQRNYDPRTHHLAHFFRDRHGARFSNLTLWGLWSQSGSRKAVYRDHADDPWEPLLEGLPKKRRVPLSEAGCALLLDHLDPVLGLCNERHLFLVDPTFRSHKLAVHEPGLLARACHDRAVPLIAIQAGSNMFYNADFASFAGAASDTRSDKGGTITTFLDPNQTPIAAKALLVASRHDGDRLLSNCPPERMHVPGSLRFNAEWIDVLLSDALSPARLGVPNLPSPRDGAVRVLFLMTPEKYNVNVQRLHETLKALAERPDLQVVVKPHTRRAGSDGLTAEDLPAEHAIAYDSDTASTLLVEWADIVVSYGTSACLQAVFRGRPLVDPVFLHGNTLIPTRHGACWAPATVEALVEGLADQARAPLSADRLAGIEAFKRQMVLADRDTPFDVLGEAADLVDRVRAEAFRAPV